jgi:hypothetical protein
MNGINSSLTLSPADHGGFIVWGGGYHGDMRLTLFAGSLAECLEFIRDHMVSHLNKRTAT